MRNLLSLAALTLAATGSINAQEQVGTATSAATFHLRGATVSPGQGVPDWPVLSGDTIKAGAAITTISFSDGSVIVLEPNSVAKVGLVGKVPVFQLLSGAATYSLKSLTAVQLSAGNRTINPTSEKGSFGASTGGFFAVPHAALIVSVVGVTAAATATALGVAAAQANSGGSQISPSR